MELICSSLTRSLEKINKGNGTLDIKKYHSLSKHLSLKGGYNGRAAKT